MTCKGLGNAPLSKYGLLEGKRRVLQNGFAMCLFPYSERTEIKIPKL